MFQDLSQRHEEKQFDIRPVYTGLAALVPVAVNPSLEELQALGYNFKEEPKYTGKDDNGVDETYITVYLKHEELDIIVPYRFTLQKKGVISEKTGKIKVINAYGTATWVTKPEAKEMATNGKSPSNLKWYVADGVKACHVGEEELVEFIRNFRYVPAVNEKTSEEDRKARRTLFTKEDMEAILKLDSKVVKMFRDLFLEKDEEGKGYKIGVLLGARAKDEYFNQDVYPATFKSYLAKLADDPTKVNFIRERVADAQDSGRRPNTDFQLDNLELKVYGVETQKKDQTSKDDLMEDGFMNSGGFSGAQADPTGALDSGFEAGNSADASDDFDLDF